MNCAVGSTRASARSVSSETTDHTVSNFDHLVTQWMSVLMVSDGSAVKSLHVQDFVCSTAPRMVKLHALSGECGVGPAERTGKSVVTYWPGGRRDGSLVGRRPVKPREIGGMKE